MSFIWPAEIQEMLDKGKEKMQRTKRRQEINRQRKKAGLETLKLETDVQGEIIEYLKSVGIWAWRSATTGQLRATSEGYALTPSLALGCPDITGQTMDGRLVLVEVKKPGWRPPSDNAKGKDAQRWRLQRSWLRECRARGGIGIVVRSVGETQAQLEAPADLLQPFDATKKSVSGCSVPSVQARNKSECRNR